MGLIFFVSFFLCLLTLPALVLIQLPGPARTVVAIRFAETAEEEDLKGFRDHPSIGRRLDVVA